MDMGRNLFSGIFNNRLFGQLRELENTRMIVLSLIFVCLTGLSAMVKFYIPWSPVPVTAQTLVVLMSGAVLGRRYGGISQVLYVVAGMISASIATIPWFAGELSFTGGYVFGFIVAALFIGYFTEKHSPNFLFTLGLMVFANFIIIYGFGLLQLAMVLGAHDVANLLTIGALPYIPGDMAKIVLASSLSYTILSKRQNTT